MPTARGWRLAASAVAAIVGGRVFALEELYVLGAMSGVLVIGAVVYARTRRISLAAARHLHPSRVTEGSSCAVGLRIQNRGAVRTPFLDLIDGDRRLVLAPRRRGEAHESAYRFVALQRGLIPVGPLEARSSDPFGVAATTTALLEPTILTVHPRRYAVLPPPRPLQGDPLSRVVQPLVTPERGEDFHALRPYQDGDDLRRIHWPSTARLDELVVRQDELRPPWEVTVVLDLRRGNQGDRSAEEAVTAAASVLEAAVLEDALARLVTTGGADTGVGGGPAHLESILDLLAAADLDDGTRLLPPSVLEAIGAATMVVITTNALSEEDVTALRVLGQRAGTLVVVLVPTPTVAPPQPFACQPPIPAPIVQVPAEGTFAPCWDRLVASL